MKGPDRPNRPDTSPLFLLAYRAFTKEMSPGFGLAAGGGLLYRAIEAAAEADLDLPLRVFNLNDLSPEQALTLFFADPEEQTPALVGGVLYVFMGTEKDLFGYLQAHAEPRLRALVGAPARLRLVKQG